MDSAEVSKETISNITDRVLTEMADRQNRPLDPGPVYPVVCTGLGPLQCQV